MRSTHSVIPEDASGPHVDLGHVHQMPGFIARCILEKPELRDVDPTVVPLEAIEALVPK